MSARYLLVAGLLAASTVLLGCGLRDPYDTTQTAAATGTKRGPVPDPEDNDPALRAQRAAELRTKPALQHLPAAFGPISVDLGPGDRPQPTLVVTYSGRRGSAVRTLKGLMARWHDRAGNYAIQWVPTTPTSKKGGER